MERPPLDRHQWIADNVLVWEPDVRRWLHRCARALTGHDIDDLIQEAYARVWRINFPHAGNGRALLFTVVNNVLNEQLRRARVVPIDTAGKLELLDSEVLPGPEQWPGACQQYEHLLQAVMSLAAQRRAVFAGHKFERRPITEIAKRLGITQQTVENHMAFALYQVTEMMFVEEGSNCGAGESDDLGRATQRD